MPDVFQHECIVEITKEKAPWAPEEELGKYAVKRWNWFNQQQAMIESTMVIDKEKGLVKSDLAEYYLQMVQRCVAPPDSLADKWSLERVRDLDPHVGVPLKDACREINGLTWEEKAGFLEQSEQKTATPG